MIDSSMFSTTNLKAYLLCLFNLALLLQILIHKGLLHVVLPSTFTFPLHTALVFLEMKESSSSSKASSLNNFVHQMILFFFLKISYMLLELWTCLFSILNVLLALPHEPSKYQGALPGPRSLCPWTISNGYNLWSQMSSVAPSTPHIYTNKGIKIQILIKSIFKTFLNTSLSNG